jgi:hypothetical protein
VTAPKNLKITVVVQVPEGSAVHAAMGKPTISFHPDGGFTLQVGALKPTQATGAVSPSPIPHTADEVTSVEEAQRWLVPLFRKWSEVR